ncbi:FAD-binding dehydrogenase [Paenarthrobacter nitroguajacolicus]|uniref:FAD-binding dehydrogenase n=1 Tax=Paenarthrobacter nitroguajacolicus TaxID=211146 RepID=UPI0015BF2DA5|nr:FAD-binding dehydrogenase [Paenarthrobacter nitroguajacolicus]NWL09800.1 FAD-binding dehydrogenase [Paenarthrobacter nitroguajacolicus]
MPPENRDADHGSQKVAADVVVVGAGLSGLVAAATAYAAGKTVAVLDQEPGASVGGQAHWSFGGLFMVNTPEQQRLGVRDSTELALSDWLASAAFDRSVDQQAREWAEAYVHFASGEKRSWLRSLGVGFFPLVQWAERGGYGPQGHGNTVPRFHVTWGTGPALVEPFLAKVLEGVDTGRVGLHFRHRALSLTTTAGRVTGVSGDVLQPSTAVRGQASGRVVIGSFEARAGAVVVTTGGIGGNHAQVRRQWPDDTAPDYMLSGVPASVDGEFLSAVESSGAALVNGDRMWHYPEGIHNYDPVWPKHGIRILPGPSSLWLDAEGHQLPAPLFPGFDSQGALRHIVGSGHGYSWFVLNRTIALKELALSGSEQNPDLTGKDFRLLATRLRPDSDAPIQRFMDKGVDFLQAATPMELASRMNHLTGSSLVDGDGLDSLIRARDSQVASRLGKDPQLSAIRASRRFATDKLMRAARPHRLTDPAHGPLIAIRLSVLTRKSLGGLTTDLRSRVLDDEGNNIPGLYAAGEAAGFGGGGMHGYRALEGTFLGGCLFTGRAAGRDAAASV